MKKRKFSFLVFIFSTVFVSSSMVLLMTSCWLERRGSISIENPKNANPSQSEKDEKSSKDVKDVNTNETSEVYEKTSNSGDEIKRTLVDPKEEPRVNNYQFRWDKLKDSSVSKIFNICSGDNINPIEEVDASCWYQIVPGLIKISVEYEEKYYSFMLPKTLNEIFDSKVVDKIPLKWKCVYANSSFVNIDNSYYNKEKLIENSYKMKFEATSQVTSFFVEITFEKSPFPGWRELINKK